MEIPKAIEILCIIKNSKLQPTNPDANDALDLAIASLNLYRNLEQFIKYHELPIPQEGE